MDIWRRICEFDYQLEMYKPVVKHRWVLRIADLARRPAARTAHQQGLSGTRLSVPAQAGIEEHRFCHDRVSGLTLSSIVAVNGSPLTDLARRSGSSAGKAHAISKAGRACVGRATNRSLTRPPYHSGNGTPHTYAASYA
jgi:hypothetical protein